MSPTTVCSLLLFTAGLALPVFAAHAGPGPDRCPQLSGSYRLDVELPAAGADALAIAEMADAIGAAVDAGGRYPTEARALLGLPKSGQISARLPILLDEYAVLLDAVQSWGTDYQIGVITTEADEAFRGRNPGELVGSPRTITLADLACRSDGPQPQGAYLRHDASLEIVFVSDESDTSPADIQFILTISG